MTSKLTQVKRLLRDRKNGLTAYEIANKVGYSVVHSVYSAINRMDNAGYPISTEKRRSGKYKGLTTYKYTFKKSA